jgi:hypothetical protein
MPIARITDWEEVGFHRPLRLSAGFYAGSADVHSIDYLSEFDSRLYPAFLALGIWGRVVQFFNFGYYLIGTSAAFIKFFAQYRFTITQSSHVRADFRLVAGFIRCHG